MTKLMKLKNKKGFTLIELIVVIAILAILAAILIPSMLGYINDSKDSVGDANARSVYSAATAAATFVGANGGTIADITTATAPAGLTGDFGKKISDNLGTSFKGKITVDVDAKNVVNEVTWQEDKTGAKIYTFPKTESTATSSEE